MAMPEEDHYPLAKCASRWGCQLDDIIQYAEMGLIVPTIRHSRVRVERWAIAEGRRPPDELLEGGIYCDEFELAPGWSQIAYFGNQPQHQREGIRYLHLSECVFTAGEHNDRNCLVVSAAQPQVEIPLEELHIPKAEVHRFDKYVPSTSQLMQNNRARDNLLRVIGLLARLLIKAEPNAPESEDAKNRKKLTLGTIEDPNCAQLAVRLLDHIEECGLSSAGLSDPSLRAHLKAAFDLLNDEIPSKSQTINTRKT